MLPRPKPHPLARPRRPVGQPTRGKTAANRLRRVDLLAVRYAPGLLRRMDGAWQAAPVIDLGYGAAPVTTLEMWARFRQVNPRLEVLGIEIEPERVAAAQPFARPGLTFALGGFNLPRPARLVRAMNVLRQYRVDEVAPALATLAGGVLPGGLLVEGTSDVLGRLWVVHLLRRRHEPGVPWAREALVFSTNFRDGFAPAAWQAVLPKDLIERVAPGDPLYDFFAAWERAAQATRGVAVWGTRAWFAAAARVLAASGYAVDVRSSWLRKGFLIWHGEARTGRGANAVIARE